MNLTNACMTRRHTVMEPNFPVAINVARGEVTVARVDDTNEIPLVHFIINDCRHGWKDGNAGRVSDCNFCDDLKHYECRSSM